MQPLAVATIIYIYYYKLTYTIIYIYTSPSYTDGIPSYNIIVVVMMDGIVVGN